MTDSFNPGDVIVNNLTVVSPRSNSWNMAPNFLQANILESIFNSSITATIEVLDDQDYLGNLKLAGDESVQFSITKPNGGTANYNFHLNKVDNVENMPSMKSKKYTLECTSIEVLKGQANHHQKAYNTTIDGIVKDIFGTLGSALGITTESTKGQRKWIASGKPYDLIETLRREAVSQQYKGSNFLFWQTAAGFFFQSIDYMLNQGDAKTFIMSNALNTSMEGLQNIDRNIIAFKVLQNFDAASRVHNNVINHRMMTYDPHTHAFKKQDMKPKQSELGNNLGSGLLTTLDTFLSLFDQNAYKAIFRVVNPNQKLQIGKSFVPDTVPYKQLQLASMQEQLLNMTVIGDTVLQAGKTINNNVPRIIADPNNSENDVQISGRWLLSKVHHEIRMPTDRPRWITHLECLKGSYQESV